MTEHEDIVIFSNGGCAKNAKIRMKFNPQGLIYSPKKVKGQKANASEHRLRKTDQKAYISEYTNYPKSIIRIGSESKTVHPTQKPVALFEYLIKTYTNPGDLVLDNCMGSGTTGVAAIQSGRRFIGIERDSDYFAVASKWIGEARGPIVPLDQVRRFHAWNAKALELQAFLNERVRA